MGDICDGRCNPRVSDAMSGAWHTREQKCSFWSEESEESCHPFVAKIPVPVVLVRPSSDKNDYDVTSQYWHLGCAHLNDSSHYEFFERCTSGVGSPAFVRTGTFPE
jgi:hypothetical protein